MTKKMNTNKKSFVFIICVYSLYLCLSVIFAFSFEIPDIIIDEGIR